MLNSICDVPGILVGHAQDEIGGTGCTVVIPEEPAVCGVEVAGGGPGTRETDALNPANFIEAVHAVYLGGGSAYGLAGADGVMRWCEENGRGLDVGAGVVPIVPGAVLYDLPVGDFTSRPDSRMGYHACLNASAGECRMGNVGAGTGASVGKALGTAFMMKGGLGTASMEAGGIVIGALVAVNCFGDVADPSTGEIVAGLLAESGGGFAGSPEILKEHITGGLNPLASNTTIGVVATNARLTKAQVKRISMMAHDGFARAINPIHTMHDGDTVFTLSTGNEEADVSAVGTLAAEVMARAVVNGVRAAKTAFGIPGCAG